MSHLYRVQVTLDRNNGLGRDAITNTYHFDADDDPLVPSEDWDHFSNGLKDRVEDFYQAIGPLLSGVLNGTGTIKMYDMHDPSGPGTPRIPKRVDAFTHDVGGSGLPSEVALCVSFKCAAGSGLNPRRRRGRVFIGPLVSGTLLDTATSEYRPIAANAQAILAAFMTMATGISGAARLAVYSPTTDVSTSVDDAFNDVVDVWIDNSFDTIRSRGLAPTSRWTDTI